MACPITNHPDLSAINATPKTVAGNRYLAIVEGEAALIQIDHRRPGHVVTTTELVIRQLTADGSRQTFRHPIRNDTAERIARAHGNGAATIEATMRMLWDNPDALALERGKRFGDLLLTPLLADAGKAPFKPLDGSCAPTGVRLGGRWERAIYSRPARLVDYAHHVEASRLSLAPWGRFAHIVAFRPLVVQGATRHLVGDGWWLIHHPGGGGQCDFGPFDLEPRDW